MTKKEVELQFKHMYINILAPVYEQDGMPDYPARSEAWNDYTDALCKEKLITNRQYSTWTSPSFCRKLNN